jgi:hypothetical protein
MPPDPYPLEPPPFRLKPELELTDLVSLHRSRVRSYVAGRGIAGAIDGRIASFIQEFEHAGRLAGIPKPVMENQHV